MLEFFFSLTLSSSATNCDKGERCRRYSTCGVLVSTAPTVSTILL